MPRQTMLLILFNDIATNTSIVSELTLFNIWSVLGPFLIGRMFLREPSWKYSAKLVGS